MAKQPNSPNSSPNRPSSPTSPRNPLPNASPNKGITRPPSRPTPPKK